MATGKFKKGSNAGTAVCSECGVTFQKANIDDISTDLCTGSTFSCYEMEGEVNAHHDGHHVTDGCPVNCPVAHSALSSVLDGTAYRSAQKIVDHQSKLAWQNWNTDYLAIALMDGFGLAEEPAYYVANLVAERNRARPYTTYSDFMER